MVDEWRIEAACRAAWPALEERVVGPWVLRRSGGSTRRTNSVNPGSADAHAVEFALKEAEAFYGPHGQPTLFRVPAFLGGLVRDLEDRGFLAEATTSTLVCDLRIAPTEADPEVLLEARAESAWIDAKKRLTPTGEAQQRAFEAMLDRIGPPARFASLVDDGEVASVGYGVIASDLLVLEAVVTDPVRRRRGLSSRVVGILLAWARSEGVEHACLQVVTDNVPALRLYRRLGFTHRSYDYAYYRRVSTRTGGG